MRLYNFCAGPATMPEVVLKKAQQELLDWQGVGASVMEVSHRGPDYIAMAQKAEHDLRALMGIDDDYAVLFLQGGAALQFSGVPLNLLNNQADYLITGAWSQKAYKEACRYNSLGAIHLVADAKDNDFVAIPDESTWQLSKADYFHYCSNETIHGIQFASPPKANAVLVADMSSDILSRPINIKDFGLIYAGAQKNIGPAGLTLVIVHKELLGRASDICPMVMNYAAQAEADSMLNTPATYAWYLAGLVFEWLIEQGGLVAIEQINQQKAALLYEAIDASDFYQNRVEKQYRSVMNVPFFLADASLDKLFLEKSKEAGLLSLKGHRAVGGMRASLYNAMPIEGVRALVAFMKEFEKTNA